MRRTTLAAAVAFLIFAINIASAELIRGVAIDFVTIGNPGNGGDLRVGFPNSSEPYGCGSVDYVYHIGMYEVTNAQWYDFVSAAGAPTGNPSKAYNESA